MTESLYIVTIAFTAGRETESLFETYQDAREAVENARDRGGEGFVSMIWPNGAEKVWQLVDWDNAELSDARDVAHDHGYSF